jgi:hypothetical protein
MKRRWFGSPLCILFIVLIQLFFVIILTRNGNHRWSTSEPLIQASSSTSSSATGNARLLHPAAVKEHFSVKQLYPIKQEQKSTRHFNETILTSTIMKTESSSSYNNKLRHKNPFQDDHHQGTFVRPKLADLVRDSKSNIILHDIQFLLDFAIIGFAKVRVHQN